MNQGRGEVEHKHQHVLQFIQVSIRFYIINIIYGKMPVSWRWFIDISRCFHLFLKGDWVKESTVYSCRWVKMEPKGVQWTWVL